VPFAKKLAAKFGRSKVQEDGAPSHTSIYN
jgi:transposase